MIITQELGKTENKEKKKRAETFPRSVYSGYQSQALAASAECLTVEVNFDEYLFNTADKRSIGGISKLEKFSLAKKGIFKK